MKILLSNDDGIYAPGIRIMQSMLQEAGHEVFVVAPAEQQSGASHRITIGKPLFIQKIKENGQFYGIAVKGTPADSVHLGLSKFYPDIDMIISGINLGHNAGPAIYYSGTVGAAFEGHAFGKRSIAFSFDSFIEEDFVGLEERLSPFLESIISLSRPEYVLNINIPVVKNIQGLRVARQHSGFFHRTYEKRCSPWGEDYYWIQDMNYQEEIRESNVVLSDIKTVEKGFIAATPLYFDLTHDQKISVIQRKLDQANELLKKI